MLFFGVLRFDREVIVNGGKVYRVTERFERDARQGGIKIDVSDHDSAQAVYHSGSTKIRALKTLDVAALGHGLTHALRTYAERKPRGA